MNKRKFKLIAIDVDGTLLKDDHSLSPEVIKAVQEVKQSGAEIVLCTGRGPGGAMPILYQLGLQGTVIVHNGGAIIDSETKQIKQAYPMDKDALMPYIKYCREHQIHFDFSNALEMMVESIPENAKAMYKLQLVEPQIVKLEDKLLSDILKFTIFGTKEEVDQAEQDWRAMPSELQLIRSGDFFIDVQHTAVSKGNALQTLAEYRGIATEDILAIGNYYNDISMLQFAGLGVAVANSPQKVKDAADYVGPSNNEYGVAHILRKFVQM